MVNVTKMFTILHSTNLVYLLFNHVVKRNENKLISGRSDGKVALEKANINLERLLTRLLTKRKSKKQLGGY